jgi:hypothetical protein
MVFARLWLPLWHNHIAIQFPVRSLFFSQVSVGGTNTERPDTEPDTDGRMMIRLFDPCQNAFGAGCTLIEDPVNLHLAVKRWYPSSLRIFDGSLVCS